MALIWKDKQIAKEIEVGEKTERLFYQMFKRVWRQQCSVQHVATDLLKQVPRANWVNWRV